MEKTEEQKIRLEHFDGESLLLTRKDSLISMDKDNVPFRNALEDKVKIVF